MPKILVLFHSGADASATLADAVAEGARAVRFTEVDVRGVDGAASRHRALESADRLADYDAVVGVVSSGADAERLVRVVEHAATHHTGALLDRTGAALTPNGTDESAWALLRAMAESGMLLVPSAGTPEPTGIAAAHALGRRVAKVAEWVRHAKSHEAHGHRDH